MSGSGQSSDSIVSSEHLAELAALFDRFEYAFDPLAEDAREAEAEFDKKGQ